MTSTTPRGKHNHFLRRGGEWLLDRAMCGGLLARWCRRQGLQGRLGVTRYAIQLAPERRLARPLVIAFASDFHAGPGTDPAVFADLFDAIALARPDLLLLGGDFVSCKAEYMAALREGLARCRPPLGKFAVLGNHDLWSDHARIQRALEQAGVTLLVNAHRVLDAPFASVSVCGMDDPWTGAPNAAQTLDGAGPVRILLMHSPDGLLLDQRRFELAFAGHTHGGQIARADGRPIVVPHGPLCRQYWHGRFKPAGRGELIVSRGVGCSTLPVRLHADPELVLCTLS